ncbi:MAG: DUF429 domain-containing protein [Aquabacterium sp.]
MLNEGAGVSGTVPSLLLGLDFSCAPTARKPLTLARGQRVGQVVRLERVDALPTLQHLEVLLGTVAGGPADRLTGRFIMGCDFPFGLPRPFVEALQAHGPGHLPRELAAPGTVDDVPARAPADTLIHALHRHCGDRAGFQRLIDGWGDTWQPERGKAGKLLHRRTDRAVPGLSSTSPLQTRYVPVGKMYFEGMVRLVAADLTLPGLRSGRPDAIALEAYPGLLAGEILRGRSYKSETDASADRLMARMDLIDALEQGRTRLGLRLKLGHAQREHLASDPKGDRLDAVLCLMQAAWADACRQAGDARWGLPPDVDPVEGWILTA